MRLEVLLSNVKVLARPEITTLLHGVQNTLYYHVIKELVSGT